MRLSELLLCFASTINLGIGSSCSLKNVSCFEVGTLIRRKEVSDYHWPPPLWRVTLLRAGSRTHAQTLLQFPVNFCWFRQHSNFGPRWTDDSTDLRCQMGKLLPALANTVINGFESCWSHDHILLSHDSESRVSECALDLGPVTTVSLFIRPRTALVNIVTVVTVLTKLAMGTMSATGW